MGLFFLNFAFVLWDFSNLGLSGPGATTPISAASTRGGSSALSLLDSPRSQASSASGPGTFQVAGQAAQAAPNANGPAFPDVPLGNLNSAQRLLLDQLAAVLNGIEQILSRQPKTAGVTRGNA